jgi:anti-sigma B factor antagonist
MNLEISHESYENSLLVYLTGEVDAYTAPKLRDILIPLTEEKNKDIIIDLSNVEYIDSTGLGVFIGALKSSHNFDSHIKLRGLSKRVLRLFKITGLDEVLDIEESEREEAK